MTILNSAYSDALAVRIYIRKCRLAFLTFFNAENMQSEYVDADGVRSKNIFDADGGSQLENQ